MEESFGKVINKREDEVRVTEIKEQVDQMLEQIYDQSLIKGEVTLA